MHQVFNKKLAGAKCLTVVHKIWLQFNRICSVWLVGTWDQNKMKMFSLTASNINQGWEFAHWFSEWIARFFRKMSKWAICSKKRAIRSFAHFCWATWAIRSHLSFLESDLSDSLTLLFKKERMSESLIFFLNTILVQKKIERIVFCEQRSKWAIHSFAHL